jgi:hypothetical protein
LPFVVPLLWVIAPQVVGQPPMLSLATPIALAVAASALCLAVVYTIDWSPTTRVKGVLMLVGLSYFTGLSLYFLKKEMVDKARSFVGPERNLVEFRPPGRDYKVNMPPAPQSVNAQPLPKWDLKCYSASHKQFAVPMPMVFTVGTAQDLKPAQLGDEEQWFAAIEKSLAAGGAGEPLVAATPLERLEGTGPGREYHFRIGPRTRIVRVYRAPGRLYYLSVEGGNLDEDLVEDFFDSFMVTRE